MFNEKQVCEQLLALCGVKSPEDRAAILGGIIREIRSKPIVKKGYSAREIKSVVQHIVSLACHEKEDDREDYIKRNVARLSREFRNEETK